MLSGLTDEAVQNMVQTFESFLSSRHDADWTGDTVSNQYLHDAILVALRQMKQPTDAETQEAICNLEIMATNLMGYVQDGNELAVAQVKALDAGIAALRQMKSSGWIPVSERLPEPISQTSGANIKNTYLVARYENCNPKGYFYGYQLARYWKSGWSGIDGSYGLSVTHWMPLPKPPESW